MWCGVVGGLRDAYGAEDPSLPVTGRTKEVVAICAKVRLEKFPSLRGERERGKEREREREKEGEGKRGRDKSMFPRKLVDVCPLRCHTNCEKPSQCALALLVPKSIEHTYSQGRVKGDRVGGKVTFLGNTSVTTPHHLPTHPPVCMAACMHMVTDGIGGRVN